MISVVVCTYNRCDSLKDTLDSLLNQKDKKLFDYEVIVVDNNSKDKTKEVVQDYMPKFNGRLKYILEPRSGKSYALNSGISAAKGEIIAFTDDDCLPQKEWLSRIRQMFKNNDKLDVVLGEAIWDNGERMYREQAFLRGNGLNMIFKRKSLDELGGFDVSLGPGSCGCSSEDRDLVYRAQRMGKNITLSNKIIVVHKSRKNHQEKLRFMYRDCKGRIIAWLKYVLREGNIFALKNIYWNIRWAFFGLVTAINNRNKKDIQLKLVQLLGMFIGILRGMWLWLIWLRFKKRQKI